MDKQAIIFEWSAPEQFVATQEVLDYSGFETDAGVFDLHKALGYKKVSVFVDSKITVAELERLAQAGLEVISVRAAGIDNIPWQRALELGINVYRVANYSPESVAEHAFALLLTIARKLNVERQYHNYQRNERTTDAMGITLNGRTIGLFGVGRIGKVAANIALGFGMKVVYYDKYAQVRSELTQVQSLAELFQISDVVSIHVPLTDETRQSINAEVLSQAKPGLILINVSRGDIMDSDAVIAALDSTSLAGVGVDVWDSGVNDDKFDRRLLRMNSFQTCHVGFFTYEAIKAILEQTLQNLNTTPLADNIVAKPT